MMKLILTSTDFLTEKSRKAIIENLNGPVSKCKILFIPNENATIEKINSRKYYNRMIEYGFSSENIYVFDFNRPNDFENLDIDAIYVGGGNTFSILDMLRKTTFDKAIINYVNKGVIYIGGSAGTHIVTRNIKHVLNFDENYVHLKNYDGLKLFDGIIFCHYSDKKAKFYNEALKSNNNVVTLEDDEYIIYTC